jgi:hypothetical protein
LAFDLVASPNRKTEREVLVLPFLSDSGFFVCLNLDFWIYAFSGIGVWEKAAAFADLSY